MLQKFDERKQIKGEYFTNYYCDKIILAKNLAIGNEELVDYLIDGLNNKMLSTKNKTFFNIFFKKIVNRTISEQLHIDISSRIGSKSNHSNCLRAITDYISV